MQSIVNCSLGKALGEKGNKLPIQEWSKKILLKWRSGLRHLDTLETVCMHHDKCFIGNAFEKKNYKCCDVLKKH